MIGNDAAITIAGSQGQFELNVRVPADRPQPARLDQAARRRLPPADEKCIEGIEAEPRDGRAPRRGDARRGHRAQPVHRLRPGRRDRQGGADSGRTLREVALEKGVDEETLAKALDYASMAHPHE